MTAEHRERLRLRYRPEDLFDLVADVRRYPDFIKLITAMRVRDEDVDNGVGELTAEARVRFKFVRERFVTRVRLHKPSRRIDVNYVEGPFHHLSNCWGFRELTDGSTLIDFQIRYSFKNPVLQMLLDANRSRAVRYLISAFEKEAERRYERIGEARLELGPEMRRLDESRMDEAQSLNRA